MADDILSEDELGALLDSIEEDVSDEDGRRIVDYNFARPDKLNPEQIRALQRLYETVAQDVESSLSRVLRMAIEVSLVSLGQLTYDVFRNSLYSPLVIQVLDMKPGDEYAVLTMDLKMALSLIDRMLGGDGRALDDVRPLTGVEEGLIENVTDRFLDRLADGWERFQRFTFNIHERESDPQFVQVIPAAEMVLVATFGVQAPGVIEPGEVCVCIPFLNIEQYIGKIGSQNRFAMVRREQTESQREHLNKVVNDTMSNLIAEVGTATLTVGEVLDLKKDDVLVLDQRADDLMTATIGGLTKLYGRPGKIGRKVGFLIDQVKADGSRPDKADVVTAGGEQHG